ncbi:MAG: HK97 family phage prohead protease [Nitrospinaceae bacterium]
MEYKSFALNLDEVSEDGLFMGYAATFGNVDLGGDIIEKGAFTHSLRDTGGRVPVLDHHQPDRQIGWNLEACEDAHGLFVRGQLDLNVQAARERHSLMQLARRVGGRTGLSIGFQSVREDRDPADPTVRRLQEVRLLEYSLVTFPMNTQAQVTAVKETHGMARALHTFLQTLTESVPL